MRFLTTVRHTGTTYFEKGLRAEYGKDFDLQHISEEVFNNLDLNDIIYTTYRNPYRVAASWVNRNMFSTMSNFELWRDQWGAYKKLLTINPIVLDVRKQIQEGIDFGDKKINSMNDASLLHRDLDENNYKSIYQYIPKDNIDYAIECCGELYKGGV
jgi:hypothetical protein